MQHRLRTYLTALFILFAHQSALFAGESVLIIEQPTAGNVNWGISIPDSLLSDSSIAAGNKDSLKVLKIPFSPDTLDAEVLYKSSDSAVLDLRAQQFHLYGDAEIHYDRIQLSAATVTFDWKRSVIYAEGVKDSSGHLSGRPKFNDGNESFEANRIAYNFKSGKGKIYDLMTREGEGFLHTEEAKKLDNNVIYAKKVRYTTCDLEHPHFYVEANPSKVVPNEILVAGPANLVIEGVRTPFVLPFALFPLKKEERQSGLILPSVANTGNFGYGLTNGGYYFSLSDYYDLSLTGDIYSSGSYGLRMNTKFKKRYKYSGNLSLAYSRFKTGSALFESLNITKTTKVTGSFRIDPKAWPNNDFSINLNFGSSNYNLFNELNLDKRLNNTYSSSMSYSHRFPESWRLRFEAKARYFQSIQNREITLTLPELFIGTQTIFPFERKNAIGGKRWYEKINFSWKLNSQNSVRMADSTFFSRNTLEQMQFGVSQKIPVSANFKVLKYFNLSPGFRYNEDWYTRSYDYRYDPIINEDSSISYVQIDTSRGFKAVRYYSASLSIQTNLYGFLRFPKRKIRAIRHKLTPSFSLSYNPNFAEPRFGYYDIIPINPEGDEQTFKTYPSLYGSPPTREFGGVNFSLLNNVEMKLADPSDTILGTRKVTLIDNLNITGNYNFVADTLQWGLISLSGYTNLFKRKVRINYNARLDPYALNERGVRVNRFYFNEKGRPLRFESANVTMNTGWTQKDMDWLGFPFNVNLSYSLNLDKGIPGNADTLRVTQGAGIRLSMDPAAKWQMRLDLRYDIARRDIAGLTVDISRDLHCWFMSFNWVPTGYAKRYTFTIQARSSLLKDLKLRKQSDPYANFPQFQ